MLWLHAPHILSLRIPVLPHCVCLIHMPESIERNEEITYFITAFSDYCTMAECAMWLTAAYP